MNVAVVIPCYNEAKRLDLEAFRLHLQRDPETSFVFVNDGSRDGTGALLKAFAEEMPSRIRAVDLPRNGGKAEAVRIGMQAALGDRPRYVAFWDADLATPLDEIPRFREKLETDPELRMILGSRVKLVGRYIRRRAGRHYVGRVAATAIANVLGIAVYDTQCGAKMFRSDRLLESVLEQPFVTRWLFDVEIIARYRVALEAENLLVHRALFELPLDVWTDVPGSKVGFKDFARSSVDLLKIWRLYPRRRRRT